jgi:hypothetical protein
MKLAISVILICIVCSLPEAEEPEYDIIYAINFFDGVSYNSTIVPYASPEIYIQADTVNAFVVRETALYYWPLTSEFKADWASRNIPLPGSLCIQDRAGNITRIESLRYAIQYDAKDIPGTIRVYWGAAADSKYAEFINAQRDYTEAVYAYNEAIRVYDRKITEYLQNPPEEPEAFPEMPLPPTEFTLMSTDVNIGFPVKIAEGIYSIFFTNPDGTVIAKTRKRLQAFRPREKIKGFQVFEEGRWSVPSNFPDSHMSLFTVPGGNLYLQPYNYLHFEGSAYNLMMNPQNRYNRGESSIWVPVSPNAEKRELAIGNQNLNLWGYKVTQLAGSKLGYIIHPLDLGDPESSFAAFNLTIPANSGGRRYRIGQTSAISVLRIFGGIELVIILVSLIPLAGFAVISFFHRRSCMEKCKLFQKK